MIEPFDVDEFLIGAETEYPPFVFVWKGEKFQLPNMYLLDPGEVRTRLGLGPDVDIEDISADQLIAEFMPEQFAAIRDMPALAQIRIGEEYQRACIGDEAGKEPPASSPPNRAARRSKRTTPRGGKTSGRPRSTK